MQLPTGLLDTCKKVRPAQLFFWGLCGFEVLALLIVLFTRGAALSDLLFSSHTDAFMDYYHSVLAFADHAPGQIYEEVVLFYPPLATLFYLFMYRMVPVEAITDNDHFTARGEQAIAIPFVLLTVLTSVVVCALLYAMRRGDGKNRILLTAAILLSYPMLYQFARGNIIVISLLFTLLFFYLKDSPVRWQREAALICLAVAAGLKIYPALFGLVLLFEKRWKDAGRCVFYGLLLFFLPAIPFGWHPLDMLHSLNSYVGDLSKEGFGYKVNFSNTIAYLCSCLHIYCHPTASGIIGWALGLVTLGCGLVQRRNDRRLLAMAIFIAAVPRFSYVYVLLFLLIPLLAFFNETDTGERKPVDLVYAILLLGCFAPFPFSSTPYYIWVPYPFTCTVQIESYCLLLLACCLIAEGCITIVRFF